MGGLAKRLILYILLFSSLVTLFGTSLQLYMDYAQDIDNIDTAMDQIEKSHKLSIINNIWVSDLEQLQIQLQGILDLPDMQYLVIIKDGEAVLSLGKPTRGQVVSRAYPLSYSFKGQDVDLGVLHAYATLDGVYKRLFDKVFIILVTQGIKTFLVSFFIFFLFFALVGRHLEKLARDTKKLTLDNLRSLISLERTKRNDTPPDELDTVVNAMNDMRANLLKDIEARMLAENALKENEKMLSAVIEGTNDVIFLKDLNGRYILANEATAIAIGRPKDEILGKTDNDLFPHESARAMKDVDSRVIESGSPYLAEERLGTTFGDTYWLTNKSPLLDENGKVTGIIGITRNITQLKQVEKDKALLEEKLRQSQKMEAVGTLAGGIAHDFNNILSVILGYSELAMDDAPVQSEYAHDLAMVIKAGHRAKELVQQILTFSRQTDIKRIPIQLQSLIKEALQMVRASIPTTIAIKDEINSECGIVLADPTQVQQILMNLCTNAHHSMEEFGGILQVELKRVTIDNEKPQPAVRIEPGEYVALIVSDTGSGIGPDVIDKVFDPYFTTKEINKGTGLGLAIIHGIIVDYGGAITVESELGKGTTFTVYFPVIREEELPLANNDEAIPSGKERVLLVDDEEVLAEMVQKILERLGYSVTVRYSSLDALATFQSNPHAFDVIITDQTMPDMTGTDLARHMLQVRPDLPIILCTGYSKLIDEEAAKSLGIREFAMKPLSKGTLAKLLRKMLDAA